MHIHLLYNHIYIYIHILYNNFVDKLFVNLHCVEEVDLVGG